MNQSPDCAQIKEEEVNQVPNFCRHAYKDFFFSARINVRGELSEPFFQEKEVAAKY